MIRNALESEKSAIYRIWKEMFSFDDQGYTDYYFAELYRAKDTLVYVKDDKIVSTLQKRGHVMMLHDKPIACYMLVGVATLPGYQKQGYMKALMDAALDEASRQCLVTCLQAYNPELYKPFGFEMLYSRKKYQFHRDDFPKYKTMGISQNMNYKDMVSLYRKFCSSFNGYMVRDERYYKRLEKQLEMEGLKILRFCNLDIDKNFYGVISVIDKEVKERINFKAEASILGHSPSQLR